MVNRRVGYTLYVCQLIQRHQIWSLIDKVSVRLQLDLKLDSPIRWHP
jgi:hypothetical protein